MSNSLTKETMRKLLEDAFIKGFASKGRPLSESLNAYLTTRLAALDDGNEPKKYYIPIPVTKFGDLPPTMEAVVVFFKNRKDQPWVAYREIDNIWFFENGESCKTPTHWLKKIKK